MGFVPARGRAGSLKKPFAGVNLRPAHRVGGRYCAALNPSLLVNRQ
jgi:hypothetical protein